MGFRRMIEVAIPGFKPLCLEHLVLDYNGTLAIDGEPIDGVGKRLNDLAEHLRVHVITADTFGKAKARLKNIECNLIILQGEDHHERKLAFVNTLNAQRTVCIGNGRNDRRMLSAAALGIGVIQQEGASSEALLAAHLVVKDINSALDILLNPKRLVATLRS